jgi:hypothetical protein
MAGLLASLNTYWSGFKKYIPSFARVPLLVEKVRAATVSGYLNLLPYFDQYTEETPEIRRAYRVMLRDPTIKSGLFDKVFSVAALDVQLEPASDSPRDEAIADFVRDCIVKFASGGLRKIVEEVAFPSLIDGHSVCEKMWDVQTRGQWKGKYVLRGLKSKDTNNLQLMGDEYRNIIALRGTTFNGGRLYDPKDFVFFTHFSLFNSQAGMSDLRAAYRAFWIMDTAWKLRAVSLDKYTLPFLIGKYKEGDIQGKAGLEGSMAQVRSENFISIPDNAIVEAVNLSQRGTADFESAIKDLREEMLLSIVGAYLQSITSDGGSGQRGNSKIHKGSTEIVKWHLGQCIADALNDRIAGLIPELVDLNFADADYPFLTLGGMNDEDLAASLAIDQGLSQMGVALSRKDIYRRYGRQKPVDQLDALMPGGGQSQPGIGGQAGTTTTSFTPHGPGQPGQMPATPRPGGGAAFSTTFPVSAGRPLIPNGTVNSVGAARLPIQRETASYGS